MSSVAFEIVRARAGAVRFCRIAVCSLPRRRVVLPSAKLDDNGDKSGGHHQEDEHCDCDNPDLGTHSKPLPSSHYNNGYFYV